MDACGYKLDAIAMPNALAAEDEHAAKLHINNLFTSMVIVGVFSLQIQAGETVLFGSRTVLCKRTRVYIAQLSRTNACEIEIARMRIKPHTNKNTD